LEDPATALKIPLKSMGHFCHILERTCKTTRTNVNSMKGEKKQTREEKKEAKKDEILKIAE